MKRWLFLLRSFFPSWKFFDDIGPELMLEARVGQSDQALGIWENCLPPIPRTVQTILVNPTGAYLHACHNHLSHFNAEITELADPQNIANASSYKITKNLVEFQLRALGRSSPPFVYQFRLCVRYGSRVEQIGEEILLSSIYECLR